MDFGLVLFFWGVVLGGMGLFCSFVHLVVVGLFLVVVFSVVFAFVWLIVFFLVLSTKTLLGTNICYGSRVGGSTISL